MYDFDVNTGSCGEWWNKNYFFVEIADGIREDKSSD